MQKVINVIALLSGLTSAALIGGAGYLLMNKDAMIEDVRKNVTNAAVEAVTNALPGMLDSAMPELPEVTSPDLPITGTTGSNISLP